MMNKSNALCRFFGDICPLAGCTPAQDSVNNGAARQVRRTCMVIGGPFTLTDQDGCRSWTDFKGQYRLPSISAILLPDVCPL